MDKQRKVCNEGARPGGLTWTCLNRFFVRKGVPGSCAGTSGEGMYLQQACTRASPSRSMTCTGHDARWFDTRTQHSGLSFHGAESVRRAYSTCPHTLPGQHLRVGACATHLQMVEGLPKMD